jgi:DNA polymerase elongation subunit (family B)
MITQNVDSNKYTLLHYYDNYKNEVELKVKNKETLQIENIIIKPTAYFYIDTKNKDKTANILNNIKFASDIKFEYLSDNIFCKISYILPTNIYYLDFIKKIVRILDDNTISHYEADLSAGDNYILDNNFEIEKEYNILYFDIETKDDIGGVEIGRDRILSICCIDNKGKEYILCDDDEKKILSSFCDILQKYDIIIGWNSDKFDFPYIKARLHINKLFFSFKNIVHLDLMKIFMNSFAVKTRIGRTFLPSYSLDNVAKTFIKDAKLEIKSGGEGYGGRLFNLFNTNRQELIAYNLQDSKLLKRLDEEFKLVTNEIEIARLVKAPLNKTKRLIPMIDMLVIRHARSMKKHFATKIYDIEHKKYIGGYVIEPIPALYTNVYIYDFESMYPNIIRTFNISPDSFLEKENTTCIKLPNGICFSCEEGIFPYLLHTLTESRIQLKKEQQQLLAIQMQKEALEKEFRQTAIKVVILSMYGILGSPYSRYYNINVAKSITEMGQYLIKNIAKNLIENAFTVITGDTDSIMFQILSEKEKQYAENIIENTISDIVKKYSNNRETKLKMKHEKTFSKFIMLTKKKYIGCCIWDDGIICNKLYFKGIELVKGSELILTKEFLQKIATMILIDNENIEKILNSIEYYKDMILNNKISDINSIVITKKVGRMPDTYKNIPIHVKLAIERKKKGERFYTSMKIPFIVIKDKPLTIIHSSEYSGEYDKYYYWKKQIYPPIERLLSIVYPNIDWKTCYDIEENKNIQKTLWN